MRTIYSILFSIFLFIPCGKAQQHSQVSLAASYNQFSLAYKYNLTTIPVWGELYTGIGNQDISSKFDDILAGLRLGIPIITFSKSDIYAVIKTGVYIPQNDYYKAPTLFIGACTGYEKFIGQNRIHVLFAEIGYVYGQKEYTQHYNSKILSISTIGKFELSPVTIEIGYGYRF